MKKLLNTCTIICRFFALFGGQNIRFIQLQFFVYFLFFIFFIGLGGIKKNKSKGVQTTFLDKQTRDIRAYRLNLWAKESIDPPHPIKIIRLKTTSNKIHTILDKLHFPFHLYNIPFNTPPPLSRLLKKPIWQLTILIELVVVILDRC